MNSQDHTILGNTLLEENFNTEEFSEFFNKESIESTILTLDEVNEFIAQIDSEFNFE